MKIFNFLITMAILSAIVFNVSARTLSPEEALSRVKADSSSPMRLKAANTAQTRLLYTETDNSKEPTVYLFSDDEGFLLVSANDVAIPLLGYGDKPLTSNDWLNPEFKWWIEEYGRQIEWAAQNQDADQRKRVKNAYPTWQPISPLLKTKWNQNYPYNAKCPVYQDQTCVTGCVATAFAQIMNFHQWPLKGSGSKTYTSYSINREITLNFEDITFDWDNMLDEYTSSASQQEIEAVANLMYAAGVASEMDYTPVESRASTYYVVMALTDYFQYQEGVHWYSRPMMSNFNWDELVYEELKNGYPVYYDGYSNTGGHAFVCDGYSGDGYFHINWGWGGMSDGYFQLSAMDPASQGIGGSSDGYNFTQSILTRIRPDREGEPRQKMIPFMFCTENFLIEETEVDLEAFVTFPKMIASHTGGEIAGTIGIKAVDTNGTPYYFEGYSFEDLGLLWGFSQYQVMIPQVPDGIYELSPAVMAPDGTWYDAAIGYTTPRTKTMVVEGNHATFYESDTSTLRANSLTTLSDFYINSAFKLSFDLENPFNVSYIGGVRPVLLNSDYQILLMGNKYPVLLEPGEKVSIPDYASNLLVNGNSTPAPGDYILCLIDDFNNIISDMMRVSVNENAAPTLSFTQFKTETPSEKVDKNNIHVSFNLECTEGYFANVVTMYIFPYIEGQAVYSVASLKSDLIFMSKGESRKVELKGSFPNGENGSKYFAHLYVNGNNMTSSSPLIFTLADDEVSTGVINVAEPDSELAPVYYNLQGARVENPVSGIYIRVIGNKAEKVVL